MIFYLSTICIAQNIENGRLLERKRERDDEIDKRIFLRGKTHKFEHIFQPYFSLPRMIATATCTIENWINFRDCRTHNNFNEVKVSKLVLFSLFDENIQYLVATGIPSNGIQMPFGCYRCRCCSKSFHWKFLWKHTYTLRRSPSNTFPLITQHNTGNIRLRHKYNM